MIFDLFDTFEVICNYKIFWFYNYTCHTWHLNSLIVANRCPWPIIFNYWTEMTLNSTPPGGTYTRLKGVKKVHLMSQVQFFSKLILPFKDPSDLRRNRSVFTSSFFSENFKDLFRPVQGSLTSLGVKKN